MTGNLRVMILPSPFKSELTRLQLKFHQIKKALLIFQGAFYWLYNNIHQSIELALIDDNVTNHRGMNFAI